MSSMPLHLLPPHIKLHILNSLQVQPTQQTEKQAESQTNPNNVASSSASSSNTSTSSSPSPSTSLPVVQPSAPLFTLSSLSPTTALPAPFTFEALTHLHTHNYCILDTFLPPTTTTPTTPLTTLHQDIAHLLSSNAFHPGAMHSTNSWQAAHVRGDQVCWLSADRVVAESVSYVLGELHRVVSGLAAVLEGLPCVASSSQLALYEAGGRYVRHLDVRRGGGGPVRRLTAIVYLNEGWQAEWGGQLRLYERSGTAGDSEVSVDVLPVYGRLLLFASEEIEHEVLPATQRRVALTTWFK